MKIKKEDTCAFCHSENIEHGVSEVVDHSLFHPITCNNCGKLSKAWYLLVYDETIGVQN